MEEAAMSIGTGTLRATKAHRSVWPAAAIVAFVMLTIGVVAVSLDRTSEAPGTPSVVTGTADSAAELGTAANTPSELSAAGVAKTGAGISFVRHVPRRGIGAGANDASKPSGGVSSPAEWPRTADATAASDRYSRHQRI
jgi:zona occludens toxin (predicted ATPase)